MSSPEESVVNGSKAQTNDLPAVDRLLRNAQPLVTEHGHTFVAAHARELLSELRTRVLDGELTQRQIKLDALVSALKQRIEDDLTPRMRRTVNLTGTVIHTNLGRAVLADEAVRSVLEIMSTPVTLEYDLSTGSRGDRDSIVEELLCRLTGAEAATVVNNNAAAVLLTLSALARNKEVIVSRGEQVEIGGAFRMPEVMAQAHAKLVEVGTTNRTHPKDYAEAITKKTALVLKVHTSNYAVQGFTSSVDESTLADIASAHNVLLATDLGSGSLIDLADYGLPREPLVREKIAAGCDVVTFSGDKLLGGPQAGLIVGRRDVIQKIRKAPLKRALRLSKLPLAALEATLRLYLRPERLKQDLPTLRLLTRSPATIHDQARRLLSAVASAVAPHYAVNVVPIQGQIGSGSLPIERLPSFGFAVAAVGVKRPGRALDKLAGAFRSLPLPVIGRIADDQFLMDLRCLDDDRMLTSQLAQLKERLT
jgi:L-seryl-tRNA(Ser) seleniumtransferase